MFLVDAGLGTPKICMQDELTGLPIKRATRFENKVGSKNVVAGESLIKKRIEERFFIDLVAGESLIKERADARFNDFVGSLDVTAGEPLLLPQRFRQNRAWIELKKIWRTKKKVKGFQINKIEGGYSVAIAGFITFLPFKALKKKRRANARFTIDSFIPKRRTIIVRPTKNKLMGTRSYSSTSGSPRGGRTPFYLFLLLITSFLLFYYMAPTASPEAQAELISTFLSWLGILLSEMWSTLASKLSCQVKKFMDFLDRIYGEAFELGMGQGESPAPEEPVTVTVGKPLLMEVPQEGRKGKAPLEIDGPPTLRGPEDLIEVSPSPSPKEGERLTPTTGDGGESSSPRPLSEKERIHLNLSTLYPITDSEGPLSPEELINLTNETYEIKDSVLEELRRLTGPVSGQILFANLDQAGITIRNPKTGGEYSIGTLNLILQNLRQNGRESPYFSKFINSRMDSIPNEDFNTLRVEDLPQNKLHELHLAKLLEFKWKRGASDRE